MARYKDEDKTYLEAKSSILRQLCNILHNKYHVKVSAIPNNIGNLSSTYYRDFIDGRREMITEQNLAKIERFIFDLYEPILIEEMEFNGIEIPKKEDYVYNLL